MRPSLPHLVSIALILALAVGCSGGANESGGAADAMGPDAGGIGSDASHTEASSTADAGSHDASAADATNLPPCLPATPPTLQNVIPKPASVTEGGGPFCLSPSTRVTVDSSSAEVTAIGQFLAGRLEPATGYSIPVVTSSGAPGPGEIRLTTAGADPALGEEGYLLTITPALVSLVAYQPAGLFRGVQTLRQLLPPAIERSTLQPGPWAIASGTIRDAPRFAWRGAMLDVARHFFAVADVKRYIDALAYYKINRFHLHLSDDQGWRIVVDAWPDLTSVGGSTEVGGATGAFFYTKAQYADLVAYALQRYIVVVPEIDTPGHTNAALASYGNLTCNGVAPALYTGTAVGFSSLCIGTTTTGTFVKDVVGEVAAMTPGPYLHMGGDEAKSTSATDYVAFVNAAQAIVQAAGKQMVGWADVSQAALASSSIAQHWDPNNGSAAVKAAAQHAKVVMSPANRAYLDMKYDSNTPLGQSWAGYVEVDQAYSWDPATVVPGVGESDVLGVESPLWSETLVTLSDVETMAFPRLPGHAELGWSSATGRSWDEYKKRIGSHGPRLTAMGVTFYASPLIPWQ